jgi:hypothetical protein
MLDFASHAHIALQGLGGAAYKAYTFALYLGSGLALNEVLRRNGHLPDNARIFVILLYLTLPLNAARVAQINFLYALCHFLFFTAWLAMSRYPLMAGALFFISFNTNSLLVFYALPFADHFVRHKAYLLSGFKQLWHSLAFFSAIPFVYFGIKQAYYKPYGLYEGYNTHMSVHRLYPSMQSQLSDLKASLVQVAEPILVVFSACLIVLLIARRMPIAQGRAPSFRTNLALGVLGSIATIFACFPYWVVGHAPTFSEWTSRHQLLMPLGLALAYVGIAGLFGNIISRFLLIFAVCASVLFWISNYTAFYIDWKKQEKLITLFATSDMLRSAKVVAFHDETSDLNAIGRVYRPYEWNGQMAIAFGNEQRFGVLPSELAAYCQGVYDQYFVDHYKASGHSRDGSCVPLTVRIFHGAVPATTSWRTGLERVDNIRLSVR